MEYEEMNLDAAIQQKKEKNKSFSDVELNMLCKSALDVLLYLEKEHSTSMYGLKPNNVFINKNALIKFADFGMAKDKAKEGALISVKVEDA